MASSKQLWRENNPTVKSSEFVWWSAGVLHQQLSFAIVSCEAQKGIVEVYLHGPFRSFAEVYQTSEEFLELTKEELEEILEDDRMSTPREQDLLDALGRWVLHDPALRAEDGVALLDKIRFGIMMNSKCFYPTRKQMKKEYTNLKTWDVWVAKFKATKAGYRRNAEGDRPVSFHLRNELYRPRIPR